MWLMKIHSFHWMQDLWWKPCMRSNRITLDPGFLTSMISLLLSNTGSKCRAWLRLNIFFLICVYAPWDDMPIPSKLTPDFDKCRKKRYRLSLFKYSIAAGTVSLLGAISFLCEKILRAIYYSTIFRNYPDKFYAIRALDILPKSIKSIFWQITQSIFAILRSISNNPHSPFHHFITFSIRLA